VAPQLAAFQEGLNTLKLVITVKKTVEIHDLPFAFALSVFCPLGTSDK
jgi:hypothetical protein